MLLYAGLSMLETPGLLICLFFLCGLCPCGQPVFFMVVCAGKHSAGGRLSDQVQLWRRVVLAAVVVAELPELIRAVRRGFGASLRYRWLPLFAPFGLIMLAWFLRPGQIEAFFGYTRPLADDETWLSLRNVLYYPRSFVLHGVPSVWFALVTAGALVWAAYHWRDPGVRIVGLFFLLGMASVMLLNHPPNPRFIAPFIPAAHLLVGLMVADFWRRRQTATGTERQRASAVLLIIGLLALVSVPSVVNRYRYAHSVLAARLETSPELGEMAQWVAAISGSDADVMVVNYFDQFSMPVLEWTIAAETGSNPPPVDGVILEPATPERTTALRESILDSQMDYLVLIEGGPWGAPFWPDYTAAFGDQLREVERYSLRLVNYGVADWLDENRLSSDWEQVKADSQQALDLGVIVYAVER
ncbi:MAG: hypothetical protein R3C44_01895 [Chloroflexota bacterium]